MPCYRIGQAGSLSITGEVGLRPYVWTLFSLQTDTSKTVLFLRTLPSTCTMRAHWLTDFDLLCAFPTTFLSQLALVDAWGFPFPCGFRGLFVEVS